MKVKPIQDWRQRMSMSNKDGQGHNSEKQHHLSGRKRKRQQRCRKRTGKREPQKAERNTFRVGKH